jgi:hypothetical protein
MVVVRTFDRLLHRSRHPADLVEVQVQGVVEVGEQPGHQPAEVAEALPDDPPRRGRG